MTNELIDLDRLRALAKGSLYFFAKGVLGFDWLQPHIHLPLCRTLENRANLRELVVFPRGWLKTTVCSQAYPMFRSIRDSNVRTLLAQNNRDNARAKLRVVRAQWEQNGLLRTLFPELLPTRDSVWTADSLCLKRSGSFPEGTFDCIGVKGQAVSRHYNLIVEDDTVAPDQDELGEETLAPTHDDVQKAIGWHRLALPLLTDPGTDEIVVVGTRWYENDLISWIEENEPQYTRHFRSCRENEKGESDPRGQVTYPERFNDEVLAMLEASLGPYFFSTLMLNHPISVGDMVFDAGWFKTYEQLPPPQSLHTFTTIDVATDPELSTARPDKLDYSTVVTAAKDIITGDIYVLDYFRARCSPGEHIAAIFDHVQRWNPIEVGYEDVAYQKSIDYWIKERQRLMQRYFLLKPVKRQGRKSKETHIMGLQPVAASGAIHLRPHHKEMMTEFLSFPRGAHDDLIDTLAMQLQMWRRTRSKREKRLELDVNDPYSFEAAVESIRRRKRQGRDSVLTQPMYMPMTRPDPFSPFVRTA